MQEKVLERIAKVMARRGVCSRRQAEVLISEGCVYVEGIVVDSPGLKIDPDAKISVSGMDVPAAEETKVWAFYKPKNCITSYKDPQGRVTLFSLLPKDIGKVVSVGRLDYSTEGLILLCNNGDVTRSLEMPSSNIPRVYKCKVYGGIPKNITQLLLSGVNIDGMQYAPIKIKIEKSKDRQHWIEMELTEGKNREIRRICEYFDLKVSRLIRVRYGNVLLDGMMPGELRRLSYHEIKKLIPSFNDK